MITIFATPKAFEGHIGLIQRNALRSWSLLHPDVEVILFGDDNGAAETALDLGIRHHPEVRKGPLGTKHLNFLFERAQQIARHDVLCYINCDIILTEAFIESLKQVLATGRPFLMVGRRWDTDITEALDFSAPDWQGRLLSIVAERGNQRDDTCIDYFTFPRGLFQQIPPVVIGRIFWDHWLVWEARARGADIIDISPSFRAVHQNHDYAYHAKGLAGIWDDELSQENLRLAGGVGHLRTIADADYRLTSNGLRRNYWHAFNPVKRRTRRFCRNAVWNWIWVPLMNLTRPIRRRLGLRQKSAN